MPQIIITAESPEKGSAVLHRERVTASDFESRHFAEQLLERIDWAVKDASDSERKAARDLGATAREERAGAQDGSEQLEHVLVGLA
jgi:hypothetical protein